MENWNTYDASVQSYRMILISSQSILLAVGAIITDQNTVLMAAIAIIALFQIWFIGFRVIRCRTIIVDYHKYKMSEIFNNNGELLADSPAEPLAENTYLKIRKVRKDVNKLMSEHKSWGRKCKFRNMRLTRIKLDVLLPLSFTFIWIIYILNSIIMPS